MRNHYNTSPSEYEALRDGYVADRRVAIVSEALRGCGTAPQVVLELGCGSGKLTGRLAALFPGCRFTGLDVDERMVAYACATYRAPNLLFALRDATSAAGLPPCEFMYSVDLLHHITDQLGCLFAARRALPTGGHWLLLEPNILNPTVFLAQERMRRAGLGEDHLRPWVVEPLMRRAGFAIAAKRYAFSFPSHWRRLPAALRWLERGAERLPLAAGNVIYLLRGC